MKKEKQNSEEKLKMEGCHVDPRKGPVPVGSRVKMERQGLHREREDGK